MRLLSVALWDEHDERARLLADPVTAHPGAFEPELARALAGFLVRHGVHAAGLVRAPRNSARPVHSTADAVAMADAVLAH